MITDDDELRDAYAGALRGRRGLHRARDVDRDDAERAPGDGRRRAQRDAVEDRAFRHHDAAVPGAEVALVRRVVRGEPFTDDEHVEPASDVPRAGVLPLDAGGHTLVSAASGPERATWLRHWAARDDVAAIVTDLSTADLAEGADDLLPAIRAASRSARGRGSLTVALRTDDAGAVAIEAELRSLGVHVERTVAAAARRVRDLTLGVPPVEAAASPFAGRPLSAIVLAAPDLAAAIARQGAPVISLAWTPPAGGDARIARLVGLLR